nr:diguanylate cyclase [Erythrobacter sp. LQ02-29]
MPQTAAAGPVSAVQERCIAPGAPGEALTHVWKEAHRWDCSPDAGRSDAERSFVRFAVPATGAVPDSLYLRRGALSGVEIAVVGDTGTAVRQRYTMNDQEPAGIAGMMRLALPQTARRPVAIVAIVDGAANPRTVPSAFVAQEEPGGADMRSYALAALICGMLVLPLMFNVMFYRVLRERFLVWHSALAVAMLMAVSCASNIALLLLPLTVKQVTFGAAIGFELVGVCALMFARNFIEPGKLHPRICAAIPAVAVSIGAIGLLHALFPGAYRTLQMDVYRLAMLPALGFIIVLLCNALWRRSRAAMFQAIGWFPLLAVAIARQSSFLIGGVSPIEIPSLFYLGCALEVLGTGLAVADRMITLRRQRDSALDHARSLEEIAVSDPLTGLLNRRGIEPRFADLREEGFDTMALIDLDRFKTVNDRFGHLTGDAVLVSCARALQPVGEGRNVIAVRMGGEEFMLLLRGPEAVRRAEALRQAITVRVARDVCDLDMPVTASMGLIEMPRDGMTAVGFNELYARADALLYEAKENGRNRAETEKLVLFALPTQGRVATG